MLACQNKFASLSIVIPSMLSLKNYHCNPRQSDLPEIAAMRETMRQDIVIRYPMYRDRDAMMASQLDPR